MAAIRIHYLQHVPHEPPGSIVAWAARQGHPMSHTELYAGNALPGLETFDWLVVMGGPMNIHEERAHPWLVTEKRFIEAAITGGKTVLGICLGAQLIAHVLGARVFENPCKEIGWFPVEIMEAESVLDVHRSGDDVFHWHGDTFDIPGGARHLARSEACDNQAFSHGDHVFALQYHLEMSRDIAVQIVEKSEDHLSPGPFVQRPDEILADGERFQRLNETMSGLLARLEKLYSEEAR